MSAHDHAHGHGHSHAHGHGGAPPAFMVAFAITFAYALVELAGGIWSG